MDVFPSTQCLKRLGVSMMRKCNFNLHNRNADLAYRGYLNFGPNPCHRGTICSVTAVGSRSFSSTSLGSGLWSRYINHQKTAFIQGSQNKHTGSSTRTANQGLTIQDVVNEHEKILREQSIPEPRESVELFVAHVLGRSTIHGISPHKFLTISEVEKVHNMVKTRLQRVPVQYILGEWDFCDITLEMRQPVFIPRPETEELVGFIRSYLHDTKLFNIRILEIGCGTGAITLALLKAFPQLQAVCIDKIKAVCDLTLDNTRRLGLTDRLKVVHRDITEDASDMGLFDLLVSNPPYISSGDMDSLDAQITSFEDRTALDGGTDGLDVVRLILRRAPSLLHHTGTVWLEVDTIQSSIVQDMLAQGQYTGLDYVRTLHDFTSRPRFCVLQHTKPAG